MAITTFPKFFLDQLDEVLLADPITGRFLVNDVRLIKGRIVEIPKLAFGTGLQDYARFTSDDDDYTFSLEQLTLANDKEKQFYVEWADSNDFPTVQAATVMSEFLRVMAMPELQLNFFTKVAARVPSANSITTAPSATNIKSLIDTAIAKLAQVGVNSGGIYMNSATDQLFENAVSRVYTNESGVNTKVFNYNGWEVITAPDAVIGTTRFMLIGDGIAKDIRKRSETFAFAPGQHTTGDGWLIQYHLIYDAIVQDNKTVGLYLDAPAPPQGG
jgi:hypothetical protein